MKTLHNCRCTLYLVHVHADAYSILHWPRLAPIQPMHVTGIVMSLDACGSIVGLLIN